MCTVYNDNDRVYVMFIARKCVIEESHKTWNTIGNTVGINIGKYVWINIGNTVGINIP